MSLSFLKSLNEKRTTRDGNPPKRRGPKPDSKPALTRRQELNRQAQRSVSLSLSLSMKGQDIVVANPTVYVCRTHRERKELYIKALEDEVLRLKELYTNICQEKEKLNEENRQLKTLISQTGLALGPDEAMSTPGVSSSGSVSGSYAPGSSHTGAFTSPPMSVSQQQHMRSLSPQDSGQHQQQQQQQRQIHSSSSDYLTVGSTHPSPASQSKLDYDQAGIDFVLTYDNPSMAYPSPPPAERTN
jgi:hypothetical protein